MTLWTMAQAERGRELAAQEARSNWDLGDLALEVVPEGSASVMETLEEFGNEIGVSGLKLKDCRRAAINWPKGTRIEGIAWTLHRDFGPDPRRFEQLRGFAEWCARSGERPTRPNLWKFTGKKPWDSETQARVSGAPVSPSADDIALAVAQDPRLAEQVVRNKAARQALGTATERHYAGERAGTEQKRFADPVTRQLDETLSTGKLISLLGQFARDVAMVLPSVGKVEPGDVLLNESVRLATTALDAVKQLAQTGQTDLDEQLEQLLRDAV